METAVKKLEVLLNKTESDVDSLSAKLNQEFASLDNDNGSPIEPSVILTNIRNLRSELVRVTQELQLFQKEQQDLMIEVKERLSNLSDQFLEVNHINEAAQVEAGELGNVEQ